MTDAFGWRFKFGVVTPSTNTIVQPDYDDLRVEGVTNHISRMHVPDDPIGGDADFDELLRRIDAALEASVERVLTCRPNGIILGISAESIWKGGLSQADKVTNRIRALAGDLPITQAAAALPAAFKALAIRKVALITPYHPVATTHLEHYGREIGIEIVRIKHFRCTSPVQIAHVSEGDLRTAVREIDGPDIDAIVQFGANLGMSRVAVEAERWIGKPVLAVNAVTYWHALRSNGIADRRPDRGILFAQH